MGMLGMGWTQIQVELDRHWPEGLVKHIICSMFKQKKTLGNAQVVKMCFGNT